MKKLLIGVLTLISINSFAQDIPEHLSTMLTRVKETLVKYSEKSPEEIYDDRYDEVDTLLFTRVGIIKSYEIIFSKKEIRAYKTKLVIEISKTFTIDQLEAIYKVGTDPIVNQRYGAKYFNIAKLYKEEKLKENKIAKRL